MKLKLVVLTSLIFCTVNTFAAYLGDKTCGKLETLSMGEWQYCYYPSQESKKLMLFFPGVWNQTSAWESSFNQKIAQSFHAVGSEIPSVLTINPPGGQYFLAGKFDESGLSDIQQVTAFMHAVIKKLGLQDIRIPGNEVIAYGNSMGGQNLMQIFLRNPSWFSRVAFGCPAITKLSPHDSKTNWLAQNKEEKGWDLLILSLRELLQSYYKTDEQWQKESPLRFLEKSYKPMANPQPILIITVEKDRFGFDKVQKLTTEALETHGHKVERQHFEDSHCFFEGEPLARFLSSGK